MTYEVDQSLKIIGTFVSKILQYGDNYFIKTGGA